MSRQDDLREVMRGLVAPEPDSAADAPLLERRKNSHPIGGALPFSTSQERILTELRGQLNENGIAADNMEIALALLEGANAAPGPLSRPVSGIPDVKKNF